MVRHELIDFVTTINNTVNSGEPAVILQVPSFCVMGLVS
jgi:hypothetical protein